MEEGLTDPPPGQSSGSGVLSSHINAYLTDLSDEQYEWNQ